MLRSKGRVYKAIYILYIISIGLCYTEILAPLEKFVLPILKDFLIAPVNLKYIHAIYAKTKI